MFVVPEELHRNAPDVHVAGPENTGSILMSLVAERLGLSDLSKSDVLDVGCGVRFAQAIINRGIPIRSYTGVDVHRPLIEYLQSEVTDPRFKFAHWNARNARYNPDGDEMTPASALPVRGRFDIIWLFSVLTHLAPSDANSMLAILRRYLRPNGALFFSAYLGGTADYEDRVPDDILAYPCYSERYMREQAELNGWRVVSVNPPSREHFIQHSLVCKPSK